MSHVREGVLRTLCFFSALGYAPTIVEVCVGWDAGSHPSCETLPSISDCEEEIRVLAKEGICLIERGRVVFAHERDLILEHERREVFLSRKLRRARAVARFLSFFVGVRAVCICNTTALAHADEASDLDFFIVTRRGAVRQIRGWAVMRYFFSRPGRVGVRDPVCFSFFVDEAALDLSSCMLDDDPYVRYWFLSLVPMFDDGVMAEVWDQNPAIRARHPFAVPWRTLRSRSRFVVPVIPVFDWLERFSRWIDHRMMSPLLLKKMNRSTDVIVSDHVLKLHAEDGRIAYRAAYRERCKAYGVDS